MPLSLKMRAVLLMARLSGGKPFHERPVAEARQATVMRIPKSRAAVRLASITDRAIPGPAGDLPIRIYTPEGVGPFPLLVYFHGGGFVVGSIDGSHELCRILCWGAGCMVVSVDYRLAPEHKFPAAPDDCLAATRWAALHAAELGADPARLCSSWARPRAATTPSPSASTAAISTTSTRRRCLAYCRRCLPRWTPCDWPTCRTPPAMAAGTPAATRPFHAGAPRCWTWPTTGRAIASTAGGRGWQPWYPAWQGIDFVQEARRHYVAAGLTVPGFEQRLLGCQLHIGLAGMAYQAYAGDWSNLAATSQRTLELAR